LGIAVVSYSPLGKGMLTGQIVSDTNGLLVLVLRLFIFASGRMRISPRAMHGGRSLSIQMKTFLKS
jgi:hypothetical protein